MSPSPIELKVVPGDRVRLRSTFLPPGSLNPREVFAVIKGPGEGRTGTFVLEGKLTGNKASIDAREDALTEKVS